MTGNMGLIVKNSFSQATQVFDRFYLQKLALDTLQEIRIKHLWEGLGKENDAIEKSRKMSLKCKSKLLPNGDTLK